MIAKETMFWGIGETCIGPVLAVGGREGVVALAPVALVAAEEVIADAASLYPGATFTSSASDVESVLRLTDDIWSGRAADPAQLPLAQRGTPFREEVWNALMRIPMGGRVTYSELASGLGRASAVRAVASAVAANRVGLLIPCHRVVRADGSPGEFRWGSEMKRRLLEREAWLRPREADLRFMDSTSMPAASGG